MESKEVDPSKIMQVGFGFLASKVFLSAVKLELFTHLSKGPLSGEEIRSRLGLHKKWMYDFLDALVSMGFLNREGILENARYSNTMETDKFLDKNKESYIGGILEMSNDRLYKYWDSLEEGLKTGKAQNEIKYSGKPVFEELYSSPEKLESFLNAMNGLQMQNFMIFSEKFDFSNFKTLCDIGGGAGIFSILVAQNNKHMKCTTLDLPAVEPIAKKTIEKYGSSNVSTTSGDFFKDDFPKADVIAMGNILHDWDLEKKRYLMKKAYEALPEDGAFIVIENIIDDERKENTFGMLVSLNMLIENGEGFDYTKADFDSWAKEAGFKNTEKMPLSGPASALIAYK
jgi:2-polyprenyl-3-methyl-5-hydroxy-6-metoxy-1,4-benzoquinol methylase